MSHAVRMVAACALPLLLIFVLPVLGVTHGQTLFVFILVSFGLHLMMLPANTNRRDEQ